MEVHLTDRGQGPPVLLLHGNPDSRRMWDALIDRLAGRHRCLAPDLPGFGETRAPESYDYSLENVARFTDAFVDAAGVTDPLNLVVHDVGGPFGLAWAVRHPERLRRIAITNTPFQRDYRWHFWARQWRRRGVGELVMRLMNHRVFSLEMRRGSRDLSRAHIEQSWAAFRPPVRHAVLRLYREWDPEKFEGWDERLVEVAKRIPTRVWWGARDPYIPERFARRFGAEQVELLPDCGHWVPVEAVDVLARGLRTFFAHEGPS